MSRWVTFETLVELVEGDHELVAVLIEEGLIVQDDDGFSPEQVDRALASRTLMRELEVNVAGVDIILRLRGELAAARRRLAELDPDADVDGD